MLFSASLPAACDDLFVEALALEPVETLVLESVETLALELDDVSDVVAAASEPKSFLKNLPINFFYLMIK